jgi:hypothetical protein
MDRNAAINILVSKVSLGKLIDAVATSAETQSANWPLQMANSLFSISGTDSEKNWFTAFGILAINQTDLAGILMQQARTLNDQPELTEAEKKKLIAIVQTFAKITKADAGRALD